MRQTIPQGGRADAASLEGFTRRSLADYLAPLDLSEAQLDTIASMISVRGGCEVFTAERAGALGEAARRSCLVDGLHRSIALGDGRTLATFVEGKEERLIFFPRPGQAGIVTFSVEAWDEDALSTRQATLTRDAQYRYALDGRWVQVLASTRERVQCTIVQREAGRPAPVTLQTAFFWPFVFGTTTDPQALFRAQISAAHAAALLGLSMLTVSRHIGEGKFPAVRSRSKYPGIDQAGLVEYMAYRRQFPQGHPNLLRVEAWQREWRHTYRAGVVAMLSSDSAGGSLCHEPQESIPR